MRTEDAHRGRFERETADSLELEAGDEARSSYTVEDKALPVKCQNKSKGKGSLETK